MSKFLKKLFGGIVQNSPVAEGLMVTEAVLRIAYNRREKEIESLLQYDRGEKTIHAPDLRKLVQSL